MVPATAVVLTVSLLIVAAEPVMTRRDEMLNILSVTTVAADGIGCAHHSASDRSGVVVT